MDRLMLRGTAFPRWAGWAAVVANVLGFGLFLPGIGVFLSIVSVAILIAWYAAIGWRLAFVTAGAPFAGAVLMLLIAQLVGARWGWFAPLAAASPILALAAIGIGVVQLAAPAPAHLGLWQQPVAVGIRGWW